MKHELMLKFDYLRELISKRVHTTSSFIVWKIESMHSTRIIKENATDNDLIVVRRVDVVESQLDLLDWTGLVWQTRRQSSVYYYYYYYYYRFSRFRLKITNFIKTHQPINYELTLTRRLLYSFNSNRYY